MNFADKIRSIPDFPHKGIDYKDITTLLKDGAAWPAAIDALALNYKDEKIDAVVSPEARGFIIGAPLSYALKTAFIPLRKAGKLPAPTLSCKYFLEYGSDVLEIHKDAINPGMRVLLADDLLATGGTALAAVKMVEELGGKVVGVAFLLELASMDARKALNGYKVSSLVVY